MSIGSAVGLAVLAAFLLLMLLYFFLGRRKRPVLRPLPAFEALGSAVESTVEGGKRICLSLGTGSITGPNSAPALAGLAVVARVAAATVVGDRPMLVSAMDGAVMALAQDTLRGVHERAGKRERAGHGAALMPGATPYSYAAGVHTLLEAEGADVHMLIGSFGAEGALAAGFGAQDKMLVIGGADDVRTQAMLYAMVAHPLIGEELYAGGAYLGSGPMHTASLRTQDLLRLIIVVGVLLGTILKTLGVIP
jgi:hypothetical protein